MRKPNLLKPPRKSDVEATIDACLANASRLMDDALMLEFQERGGGRLAICMLAQEEYAKAFLLYMVREELLPWDTDLLRILRSHACKHLLAIIMEYVSPDWEIIEELQAKLRAEYDLGDRFPSRISSALNILYFEMIRRGNFFDDNEYEPDVLAVAVGERDREKQDAIYIDVDKSCRVKKSPSDITRKSAAIEYERASRYGSIVAGLLKPDAYEGLELRKLKDAMKLVFWQEYKAIASSG